MYRIKRLYDNKLIQSSGSAVLKIALVLLRRWINHSNLQGKIQILMPYHDKNLLWKNSFNCGKLLKFISTGKDNFMPLHEYRNGYSSNNLISIRQSAAIL